MFARLENSVSALDTLVKSGNKRNRIKPKSVQNYRINYEPLKKKTNHDIDKPKILPASFSS